MFSIGWGGGRALTRMLRAASMVAEGGEGEVGDGTNCVTGNSLRAGRTSPPWNIIYQFLRGAEVTNYNNRTVVRGW